MRRGTLVALATALALSTGASAAGPPGAGTLVAGRSLGGLRLGATPAQVERTWGRAYGVCRSCRARTWYFNLHAFEPQGAGVEFRAGRVNAIFTLWSPRAWHDDRGLLLGDSAARVTQLYGPLVSQSCGSYTALTLRASRAVTAFYVVSGKVWGFGLLGQSAAVCR